jgi:hypothetical protein
MMQTDNPTALIQVPHDRIFAIIFKLFQHVARPAVFQVPILHLEVVIRDNREIDGWLEVTWIH